ncbi:MAG: tRNA (adenosine(37)-N6)-dimethylallyltransferase MiaA [Clostridia bacterium]|nr:tRNA (adenosine(37)-N6)-dimethylallyltransferase MiaA [Clostridia bacterium]MBR5771810.1 tRNA (adenosine(37)-N6)-dimethylallyltransferase MiaA [Clostridia bacterium]
MEECKKKLYAVVGPTASGKTALGVEICKRIGGEVVSCDSMQIYRHMDIATAKPTAKEMQGIPHHLIDFLEPDEVFSVADYCEKAAEVIDDIHSRGRVPVLVGGTGLYYSSLAEGLTFFEEKSDFEYRELLKARAGAEGGEVLLKELQAVDPEAAAKLHPNNTGRIIRALEIYHTTGKTITQQNILSKAGGSRYDVRTVCLDARNRDFLYDRINRRVDEMIEAGLVEEAKRFYDSGFGRTAVQAIGYKELLPFLRNEKTLSDCVENLKMQTRRYAKRQLTWFRHRENIDFLYIDDGLSPQELAGTAIEIFQRM